MILTRTPTFHGLAINAVTNESAKTPPSGRGAKVLQPQYSCRARAGEFGKLPHTRIDYRLSDDPQLRTGARKNCTIDDAALTWACPPPAPAPNCFAGGGEKCELM